MFFLAGSSGAQVQHLIPASKKRWRFGRSPKFFHPLCAALDWSVGFWCGFASHLFIVAAKKMGWDVCCYRHDGHGGNGIFENHLLSCDREQSEL